MSKRAVIIVILLVLSLQVRAQSYAPGYADLYDSEVVARMRQDVEALSNPALRGRKMGSEGEKHAAEYVGKALEDADIDLLTPVDGDVFGVKTEKGDTLVSRNVYGCITGYDTELKNSYIVVGARLDNLGVNPRVVNGESLEQIFCGANGNASGLAMLLALSRRLQMNSILLRRSVIIAAFGASVPLQAGSWYFMNTSFSGAPAVKAMVNLDMLGTGANGFYAYTASNQDMNDILSKMSGTLQPVQPKLVGMEPCASDHRSFYNCGVPSIFFTSGMYPEYNSERDLPSIIDYSYMERELEFIYNYVVALSNGPAPVFNQTEELKKKYVEGRSVVPYSECDIPPTFLGSAEPSSFLVKWVYTYLRYPQSCVDEGVQGRVLVDFIITEKGKVTDVKVLRGADPRLDEEAVRVIKASPDWKPGKVRGQKVSSEVSMYVEFKLKKIK